LFVCCFIDTSDVLYIDCFVIQEQFIVNDTLRNNILFGSVYNEERYRAVLHWCCLEPDLLCLVDGDLTEIGAFGVNLSGGQKARVALARAAYVAGRQVTAVGGYISLL
jgi:ABC-type multidrug transport system fused ATPase/permease subunit